MITSPPRSRALLAVLLATMLAGCPAPGTPVRMVAGAAGPVAPATLAGLARFPVAVVGADAVATVDGARVIPTGVAKVVPTGVGKVVPTGVGKYALLAAAEDPASEELPVVGAAVVVRDPATRAPLPGVATGTTDAQGRFRVDGLPADAVALVEITFTAGPDGRAYHLLTLARLRPDGQGPSAELDWATTAAAGAALRAAALDPGAFASEAAAIRARVAALPAGERTAWLRRAVAYVPAAAGAPLAMPADPGPLPDAPALPGGWASSAPGVPGPGALASTVPGVLASTVPGVLASTVPGALASTIPGVLASTAPSVLASAVPDVLASAVPGVVTSAVPGAVGAVASAVPSAVASTTTALTAPVVDAVASTAPALVGATDPLSLLATPTPTPTPEPSPTPSPSPSSLVGTVLNGLGL